MIKACDTDTIITQTILNELKQEGYSAVGLYTKNLNATQLKLLAANYFGLFIIHEGHGDAATFALGASKGNFDGVEAYTICNKLDVPTGTYIFSAVDFPATASQASMILAYEAGFAYGIAPYNPGLYADGVVLTLEPPGVKTYVPGATGWPGTRQYLTENKAALVQHATVQLKTVSIDPVDVIDESVLWWPGGKPTTATVTPSSNIPTTVRDLQHLLQVPADGVKGPQTQAALLAWYNSL